MPHHVVRRHRAHVHPYRRSNVGSVLHAAKFAYHTGQHVGKWAKGAYKSYVNRRTHDRSGGGTKGTAPETDYFTPSAGGKYCKVFFKVPPLKHQLRRVQHLPYILDEYNGSRQTCGIGRQAYFPIFQPGLATIYNVAAAAIAASGGPSASTATFPNQVFIKSFRSRTIITNAENVAAEVSVWLLRPIGIHSISPSVAARDGIDDVGGTSTNYLDYDQSPLQSVEFKKAWRVLERKRVFIMPGETVKYDAHILVNKAFSIYDDSIPGNQVYDSRYTYQIWVTFQGGAVTNDATTKTTVSTSSACLNWINRYEIEAHAMDTINKYVITPPINVLASTFAGGENVMNEDTAAAVPATVA